MPDLQYTTTASHKRKILAITIAQLIIVAVVTGAVIAWVLG